MPVEAFSDRLAVKFSTVYYGFTEFSFSCECFATINLYCSLETQEVCIWLFHISDRSERIGA